jgi:RNA polymerase primary sigma factor
MGTSTALRSQQSQSDDSLSTYLHEISRYPLLDRDAEAVIAARAAQGDAEAIERLVCSNLRFVVSVAKKYRDQGLSMSDLINEGNIGLIRAAEKFDAQKGVKFITYAVWWIRQAMIAALATQAHVVRVPTNRAGTLRRLRRSAASLQQELGREPTRHELADQFGVTEEDVDLAMTVGNRCVSLDAPVASGQDASLMDFLSGDAGDGNEEESEASARAEWISSSLGSLPEREAQILRMHFGFDGDGPMTLEDIGASLGITRERVRQVRDKALSRLRKSPTAARVAPRRRGSTSSAWQGDSASWKVLSR